MLNATFHNLMVNTLSEYMPNFSFFFPISLKFKTRVPFPEFRNRKMCSKKNYLTKSIKVDSHHSQNLVKSIFPLQSILIIYVSFRDNRDILHLSRGWLILPVLWWEEGNLVQRKIAWLKEFAYSENKANKRERSIDYTA